MTGKPEKQVVWLVVGSEGNWNAIGGSWSDDEEEARNNALEGFEDEDPIYRVHRLEFELPELPKVEGPSVAAVVSAEAP